MIYIEREHWLTVASAARSLPRGRASMPARPPAWPRSLNSSFPQTAPPSKGTLDFWYSHALVSDEVHEGIHKSCNFRWGGAWAWAWAWARAWAWAWGGPA
jgi:hypothetical protein